MRKTLGIIGLLTFLFSCGNHADEKSDATTDSAATVLNAESAAKQRVLHFWDDFNFGDTALVVSPQIGEQKLVNFIALLPTVDDSIASQAIQNMLKEAEVNEASLRYYIKQYAHYLYDPNSPMRSELYYQPVLEYLVQSPKTGETDRSRYQTLLKLVRKNQPGTTATDFSYVSAKGERRQLHEGKADYKMLLFYDPTCSHCAAVLKDLISSRDANMLVERGQLEVVAICPQGNRSQWEDYESNIPANWTNGFDDKGEVIRKGLYNIQAYPTIFLLDKHNKVLLKDAPLDVTLRYLLQRVS